MPLTAPDDDPSSRWRASGPLLAAGGGSIVAGGFAAAATGPTGWDHGSWVAALLVLVAGVAQVGLGAGQAHLATIPATARYASIQWVLWNLGCLFVVSGTLLSSPLVVTTGSASLVAALTMSTLLVRATGRRRRPVRAYRSLVLTLLVSIPVGVTLSWTRH